MNHITLNSEELIISEVLRKTTAKFWKDLSVGDTIKISMNIKNTSCSPSGGIYATYLTVYSPSLDKEIVNSQTMVAKYLSCFKFVS